MFNSVTTTTPMTAKELAQLSIPDKQVELVRGHLVVREPPSTRHGGVAGELYYQLSQYVRDRDLGRAFPQDTGFKIASDPDTVRGPDVAFVSRDRLHLIPDEGYAELAPDLVAEVVSPGDRTGEVLAKVGDWLAGGTRLVWVIDPRRVEARIFRPDGSVTVLGGDQDLDGEDIVPGFSCKVNSILS
jgi:Uma2 family endonuclease